MNQQHNDTGSGHLQVISVEGKAIFSFALRIGHWKNMFEEAKYKWIIAIALNYWIETQEQNPKLKQYTFKLAGYLIANGKLGLVLKIEKKNLRNEIIRFEEILSDFIMENIETHQEELLASFQEEEDLSNGIKFHHLFENKTPMNYYLTRLITGRKVKLPYYNPHIAKLEEKIRNYNFCSAIDYGGAESPVKISLLSEEELDRLERTDDN